MLIVQADEDRDVPLPQASQLIADLRSHGIAHDELMLPNEVHDMSRYASWMTLFHATDDVSIVTWRRVKSRVSAPQSADGLRPQR